VSREEQHREQRPTHREGQQRRTGDDVLGRATEHPEGQRRRAEHTGRERGGDDPGDGAAVRRGNLAAGDG